MEADEYQKAQEKWMKEKEESNKKAQEELANMLNKGKGVGL